MVPDETLRGKYIRQIEVLSQLRNLDDEIRKEAEEMALIWDIEKDFRFRQGLQKGREEGLLSGIDLAITIKFGTQGLAVMDKIKMVADIDKLEKIEDIILRSANIDELTEMIDAIN
ncbi:MAG: hypothetical protein HQK89_16785 [Nitrospirae bacterium]|nr:hypothetical protein [Nitrospirota bacterium]